MYEEHCYLVAALPCNDLITHIPLPLSKGEEGLLEVKTTPFHLYLINAICKFINSLEESHTCMSAIKLNIQLQ
jgi:hypothetical protein